MMMLLLLLLMLLLMMMTIRTPMHLDERLRLSNSKGIIGERPLHS